MPTMNNGAVLPAGLLGDSEAASIAGFNKSYKNFPLRVGVVTASYPVGTSNNRSRLTTEYDVLVVEQNEDRGATTIQYRNCLSTEGMGSIADYFEKALRPKKKKFNKGATNLKGQDGAIVLLLCLDGMSDKGIIISSLTHPDRKTNLKDEGPYLQGEYNGIRIIVNTDGSTNLVFRGATDSLNNPIDSKQGNTTIKIEADGSFQVDHDSVTFRMDRTAQIASLMAKKDINMTAGGNINMTATGDVNVKCENANVNASGKIIAKSGGNTEVTAGGDAKVTATGKATVNAAEIDLNGSSGKVLTNETDPVVDTIFGEPSKGVATVKAG